MVILVADVNSLLTNVLTKSVLRTRVGMDPHHFEKPDPDPHQIKMRNPNTHERKNSGAVEAHNAVIEGRRRPQWRRR